MTAPVLITGASGAVGGRVARSLAGTGVPLRLFVRTPAKAPDLPNAEVVVGSYSDAAACARALDGVSRALMISATESPDRRQEHANFIGAAAAVQLEQLVYTSFAGASPEATFTFARDHFAAEQEIKASGVGFTILRDNFYLDVLRYWVGDDGVIAAPGGSGTVAAVARHDVAAVATQALLHPEQHRDATYTLTGPQSLSLDEVAEQIGAAEGREVVYRPETLEQAYASRAKYDAPAWQVDAWVSTYTAIANGELAQVTDDVEKVTGHPPLSLGQVLRAA